MAALWSANDDPTGKPKYANTANVYGVNRAEARVKGRGVSPGWVGVAVGTGGVATLTITAGGSGYVNADVITIDGGGAPATSNATYSLTSTNGANLAGTVSTVSGAHGNVIGTGTTLNTSFANGQTMFVYSNTTSFTVKKINQVVNSTFLNVTTTWAFANATANYGKAGIITSVSETNPGAGFTTASNVAVTSTDGVGATFTVALGGKAGRINYENMVVFKGDMAGDAADDTPFPDA